MQLTSYGPDGSNARAALEFRAMMAKRVDEWRLDYAALALGVIGASSRSRVRLSRDLASLIGDRDEVVRALDQLATADRAGWTDARARVELAWVRLLARTEQLERRIRRSTRSRRGGPRGSSGGSRIDYSAPGVDRPISDDRIAIAPMRSDPPIEADPPSQVSQANGNLRCRVLRLWAAMLIGWGRATGSESAELAGVRYRLIAALESGGRPVARDPRRPQPRARSVSESQPARPSGQFAFAGQGEVGW